MRRCRSTTRGACHPSLRWAQDGASRCQRWRLRPRRSCPEYQQRQCNLSGRFLFFIPGVRSISAFELHTNSFYAMNAAIRKFETVAFLRGGRISGFLDRQRTPFYLSKTLMEVAHIDEHGRPCACRSGSSTWKRRWT
jgi:hypothetical protein